MFFIFDQGVKQKGIFSIDVGRPEGPLSRVKKERKRRNTSDFQAKKGRGLT